MKGVREAAAVATNAALTGALYGCHGFRGTRPRMSAPAARALLGGWGRPDGWTC